MYVDLFRFTIISLYFGYKRRHYDRFMAEIKEAITRPAPNPMRIDAINNRAEVLRNMNPTPRPIRVVPEITHVLLSFFIFILMFLAFSFNGGSCRL